MLIFQKLFYSHPHSIPYRIRLRPMLLVFVERFLFPMKTPFSRISAVLVRFFFIVLCTITAAIVYGCGSSRTREFALDSETVQDSSQKRPLYITGKKPISQADPDGLILDVWKVESEDYPKEVRVFARVLDSSGNFISGMADPYYKGEGTYKRYWTGITQYLGGDTVKVTDYTVREYGDQDSITYALALTLDHGGSMAGAVQYLLEAARIFVKMKYPNDRIAIAKFDKKVTIERGLTADVRQLDSALLNTDLRGYGLYTALYDGMKASIGQLTTANVSTPRALVVFTDGEDNASKTSDAELYRYAKAQNVRIFPVGFGYTNDSTLQALASLTGGKFYKVRSKSEFQSVFKDIYESLRNFYKISYSATPYTGRSRVKIALNGRGDGELSFDGDGFNKDGFDINGYDRNGFDKDGFDPNGFDKNGFDRNGFGKDGKHKNGSAFDGNGFDKDGYDKDGFNKDGFNKRGFGRDGKDKNGAKASAFDKDGYDKNGFNKDGYDRNGLNKDGYDKNGFGRDGYDRNGYDKNGLGKDGYDKNGFNADGYDLNGYDRNGFDKNGYDRNGFDGSGFNRGGFHKNGTRFDDNGFDSRGYGKDGYNARGFNRGGIYRNGSGFDGSGGTGFASNGYDKNGYGRDGYDRNGFDQNGKHKNGSAFDGNGYDRNGLNKDGFDKNGYDRNGFDKNGYDRNGFDNNGNNKNGTRFDGNGYDRNGYDKNGNDRNGFNTQGFDKNGYDRNGLDKNGNGKNGSRFGLDGFDRNGFNKDGYDRNGYDKNGFSKDGYNRNGFDRNGLHRRGGAYDENGYNILGYDGSGYDKNGFNKDGKHRSGGSFDEDGYDQNGYDRKGFNRFGFDKNGKHKLGSRFDGDGYDRNGYDRNGFNRNGFNKNGYDRFGFDKNGNGRNGRRRTGKELAAFFEIDKSPFNMFDTLNTVFSTTKIYFDYKKADIRPESAPMLDAIAGAMLNAPRTKIEVRGHTDNIGGEEFNQRLSELRAAAVVQALVERGVKVERLRSKGYGMSQPVATNETEDDRQKNRRTEFAIIAR